jgi:hypothetical protein
VWGRILNAVGCDAAGWPPASAGPLCLCNNAHTVSDVPHPPSCSIAALALCVCVCVCVCVCICRNLLSPIRLLSHVKYTVTCFSVAHLSSSHISVAHLSAAHLSGSNREVTVLPCEVSNTVTSVLLTSLLFISLMLTTLLLTSASHPSFSLQGVAMAITASAEHAGLAIELLKESSAGSVMLAGVYSSCKVVVAGLAQGVEEVRQLLPAVLEGTVGDEEWGKVEVIEWAAPSPMTAALTRPFKLQLGALAVTAPRMPLISTVTGTFVGKDPRKGCAAVNFRIPWCAAQQEGMWPQQ